MNATSSLVGALVGVLFATAAQAAVVLDQEQALNSANPTSFVDKDSEGALVILDLAQSFQQQRDNIVGAAVFIFGSDEAGAPLSAGVTISLWNKLPNETGAEKLRSGSGTAIGGNWFEVSWSRLDIAPDTTYFLQFESGSQDGRFGIAGYTPNPYSRGRAYGRIGFQELVEVDFDDDDNPFFTVDYDYAFRTYADDGQQQVPEPATVALLGLGLAGLASVRRRKR